MVGMDPFMDLQKTSGHTSELQRLRDLHAVLKNALDGKLVQAPIDLSQPGKRILDSGTADGAFSL
jgi:pseurotin biosynthesis methyltransferase